LLQERVGHLRRQSSSWRAAYSRLRQCPTKAGLWRPPRQFAGPE
jgi:hypothetical protein